MKAAGCQPKVGFQVATHELWWEMLAVVQHAESVVGQGFVWFGFEERFELEPCSTHVPQRLVDAGNDETERPVIGSLAKVCGGVVERGLITARRNTNSDQPEDDDRLVIALPPRCDQVLLSSLKVALSRVVKTDGEELLGVYGDDGIIRVVRMAKGDRSMTSGQRCEKINEPESDARPMVPRSHAQ